MQWLSISFVCSNISEVIYNHHTPNSLLPCQGRQYSGGGGLSTAFCTLPSIKVLHNLYFSTEGLQLCLSFFSTAPIVGSDRGEWGATWGLVPPFLGLMNTSVFWINVQFMFVPVVLGGVVAPSLLVCRTWHCPCFSVDPKQNMRWG